jgi:hypothetical protein
MVVKQLTHIGVYHLITLLGLYLPTVHADLMDAEKAEEIAKKAFAEKYLEFTSDKNVMGKASSVDGKVQLTGNKTRFDGDDGVSYKSDLTYHDFAYTTEDEGNKQGNQPNQPSKTTRTLQPFVSGHGGLSESGGSSILERIMYQEFDKYSKEKEKDDLNKKKEEEETGIKYRGVYKITTKEIFEDPKTKATNGNQPNGPNAPNNKAKEKDKVERLELREDTAKEVKKVGDDSAETVFQAAKDKENKDDPNALPNELLLYDAAAKATNSMWNAGMANLYQRRIFKGLNDSSFFDPPKLSEESPDCSSWEKQQQEKLAKLNPQERQDRQKEFELMKKGCEQMSKMAFNAIDPRYEADPNNPKVEILKERGPEKEDPFARDMRVRLELMSEAGKDISEVQTNWKYEDNDQKVELKNDNQTVNQTMAEQLESYNKQLEAAKAAYDEVAQEAPSVFNSKEDPTQYKIEPGTRSVMEINQRPAQGYSDFGVEASKLADPNAARNYEELIKNVK